MHMGAQEAEQIAHAVHLAASTSATVPSRPSLRGTMEMAS
jgi:hypothetical protein